MDVSVRTIEIDEIDSVVNVLNHIPEFDSVFYKKKILERISKVQSIILIAEFAGKPVACKIAYNRYFDGSVYSWLGGVLVPYRNEGIATKLLKTLEMEAKKKLFLSIKVKTRSRHINMLQFSLKNGFYIYGFIKKDVFLDSRIELMKNL